MTSDAPTRVSRKQMEAQLIDKAWRDGSFKRDLVANPMETIARELGVEVPAGVTISVFTESSTEICLVIPVNPFSEGDRELSDSELGAVAGGAQGGGKAGSPIDPGGFDSSQRALIAGDRFPFGP